MTKLIMFQKESVRVYDDPEALETETYSIHIKESAVMVYWHGQSYLCRPYHLKKIGEVTFCFQPFEHWYKYNFDHSICIGRSKGCDLIIEDRYLSNQHFLLKKTDEGIVVEDQQTTNGTFVNGHKIRKCCVYSGQSVIAGQTIFYIFESFLILNHPVESKEIQLSFPSVEYCILPVHMQSIIPEQDGIEMDIEAPLFENKPVKEAWFLSVGSSLMILAAGVISSVVSSSFYHSDPKQALPLMINSCSMGFGFLMFALYSRRHRYRLQWKAYINKRQAYLNYIDEFTTDVQKRKEKALNREQSYEKEFCRINDSNYGVHHPLWVGTQDKNIVRIRSSFIRYENRGDELVCAMQKSIEICSQPVHVNTYYEFPQKIWISHQNMKEAVFLFEQWIWTMPSADEKWIWACSDQTSIDRFYAFENCREGKLRLAAGDFRQFSRLANHLVKGHKYIVFTDMDKVVHQIDQDMGLIYMHKEHTGFDFDVQIQDQIPYFTHTKEIRSLLWQLSQSHQRLDTFWNLDQLKLWYEQKEVCLCVPIGIDNHGSSIYLDLHEQKDGPHGLVAGMTGSGKSSWLGSFLLQLVIHNHPKYLQYFLVDFKGGAFGQPFYEFPHCAGMVTNLDVRAAGRWLDALHGEIEKRQKLLHQHMISKEIADANIDALNQNIEHPVSHLLIIVDEFAQLKMKYPEMMNDLKEISRIGRSLGIHLILCTQKPAGIVDEQIWANSRFKICFQVNSEQDSREVLHNEKACELHQAGTFIFQTDQRKDVLGKGLWMHEAYDCTKAYQWQQVDEEGNPVQEFISKSTSVLEKVESVIDERKHQHSWILYPDLNQKTEWNNVLAYMDIPKKHSQIPWVIEKGESCIVFSQNDITSESWIQTIITHFQSELVYTVGIHEPYVDGSFEHSLLPTLNEGTVILRIDTLNEWKSVQYYLQTDHLRVFVIIGFIHPQLMAVINTFTYKACLYWEDKDAIRTYFGQFHVPAVEINTNYGWLYHNQEWISFYFKKKIPLPLKREPVPVCIPKGIKIGYDRERGSKVCWNQERTLLVIYVQDSKKNSIFKMLEGWQLKEQLTLASTFERPADIYVMHCIDQASEFESIFFRRNVYDMDILWVGLGVEEYGYLFRRKIPYEYHEDAVFWTGRKCWMVLMDE